VDSPAAISEAERRLMAMLVKLDPLLAVKTPPDERSMALQKKRRR
jgi:hypothetical protein